MRLGVVQMNLRADTLETLQTAENSINNAAPKSPDVFRLPEYSCHLEENWDDSCTAAEQFDDGEASIMVVTCSALPRYSSCGQHDGAHRHQLLQRNCSLRSTGQANCADRPLGSGVGANSKPCRPYDGFDDLDQLAEIRAKLPVANHHVLQL